ncbi:MAG: substrate-binding domain-containing protein [Pseudomonadota bacterium]|nr:substrate-binding domain-containing protein [Pseudomonadota bacterium]
MGNSWTKLTALAALLVCAAAGQAQDAETSPTLKPAKYRFGLIAKSQSNPVFQAAYKGALAAAADYKQRGVEIEIDWRTPNEEDAQKQSDAIEQLANSGIHGISVSCSDGAKLTNAINDAVAKGVPVMCFDSDAPRSKRFAYFGVDDMKTGGRVMEELAKILGKKGRIAVLAGNQSAPNLQARVRGVLAKAKELGYSVNASKDVFYHKETPQDSAAKVEEVMNSNPDIVGWAMVGGWPLFTDALLKMDPDKVAIVSVDALPAQLPYVEAGVADMLLAQKVFDWGYRSVELLVAKVQGQQVPEKNISELVPVTKESLKDWAKTLKSWGFEVNPRYLQ